MCECEKNRYSGEDGLKTVRILANKAEIAFGKKQYVYVTSSGKYSFAELDWITKNGFKPITD